MTTYEERTAMYDKAQRHAKRATAYLKNASVWLPFLSGQKMPPPVDYWQLLDAALDTAADIVEALPDNFFVTEEATDWFGLGGGGKYNQSDEPLDAARKLVAAIVARRERGETLDRIRRLENVTGRTPQEARAYMAKAEELRSKMGGRT